MNYKQLIKETGIALQAHHVGQIPHVLKFWNLMEFNGHKEQALATDAQLHINGLPTIHLFPSVLARPGNRAKKSVLVEFGLYVFRQGGDQIKNIWEKKLGVPTPGQVSAVDQKLKNPDVRKTVRTYRDLTKTFDTAVDRLVALNIFNALIVNNVAFSDSVGVDINTWGATLEYCNRRRYHSLVPLISVYAPRDVGDCFGQAFANLILNELGVVRESSTKKAFAELIANIVDKIR